MERLAVALLFTAFIAPVMGLESLFSSRQAQKRVSAAASELPVTVHHFHVARMQPVHSPHKVGVKSLVPLVRKEIFDLAKIGKLSGTVDQEAVDQDKGKVSPKMKSLDLQALREQKSEAKADWDLKRPPTKEGSALANDLDKGKISMELLRLAQKAELERNEEEMKNEQALEQDAQDGYDDNQVGKDPTSPQSKMSHVSNYVNLARKAVQERNAEVSKGEHEQAADDAALVNTENSGKRVAMQSKTVHSKSEKSALKLGHFTGKITANIIDEARLAMHERDEERADTANQLAVQDQAAVAAHAKAEVAAAEQRTGQQAAKQAAVKESVKPK